MHAMQPSFHRIVYRPLYPAAQSLALLIFAATLATSSPGKSFANDAPPADQLGRVNFPTSCDPHAQPALEKGLALLHSFQYTQALETFRGAANQDPKCAMADWGKAMAHYHQLWDFPQPRTLKEGLEDIRQAQQLNAPTERERGYIAAAAAFYQDDATLTQEQRATAYSAAMAKLHQQAPQDVEAAELYALSLVALAEQDVDARANRVAAMAILKPIFEQQPNSPGAAHYLIHAADTPEFAAQGLAAARAYAKIAPDSSHAIHMPSHIFNRLGLWQESVASNITASAAAEHATDMHMSESDYQTHAMDYLDYAYLQSGQEAKARGLAVTEMSVHGSSQEDKASHRALLEARNALELHRWKEAATLKVPDVRELWQDNTYWARAIGAARSGDVEGANADVEKLKKIVAVRDEHNRSEGYKVPKERATDLREAEAWLAFAEGKISEGIAELTAAAEREEKEGAESVRMPAREMLADMYAEMKKPAEALAAYNTALKYSPNRFDALYGAGLAAKANGDAATSQSYFAKLSAIAGPGADRPELAEAKTYLAQK
jgi:tetratricopeptide (TPR) repeat protein